MPSVRQVASYGAECIGEHLLPDALGVKLIRDDCVQLTTRKAGTANERGDVFLIRVEKLEGAAEG